MASDFGSTTPNASLSQQQQTTISPQLSPKSHSGASQAGAMSVATHNTQASGQTFLSGDLSVKTSDSLSHYLKGIDFEDEISGDVGQEVELVAHAPMLGESRQQEQIGGPPQLQMEHQNHRHLAMRPGSLPHVRATPPRYHHRNGSSQKSGSSRRRKRRSDHIPSNSGKVQVDWSLPPTPSSGNSGPDVVCGAVGALSRGNVFVTTSQQSSGLPCGENANNVAASCGVILPTPLRSSNNRSPTTSAMAPHPVTSPTPHNMNHHMAPLSPDVHSLDLEKMSLCGTENVSQTGGSIGGASLCNVFDEHDSVVGANALMDMTMSLGSGNMSSGQSTSQRSAGGGGQQGLGLHPIPLGLHPQNVFGDSGGNSAMMDMSVGSGNTGTSTQQSKTDSKNSSSSRSRGSGSRGSGRGSPASVDKASLEGGMMKMEQEEGEQHHQNQQLYADQDYKFTWDGKREE